MLFKLINPLTFFSPIAHHPTARVYSLSIISFQISPSSLIFSQVLQPLLCLRCTALWNRLLNDQSQFAYPPNPPLNFTYPSLALCYNPITTEDRTLQAILSRFSWAETWRGVWGTKIFCANHIFE